VSIRAVAFVEAVSGASGHAKETVTMPQYLLSVWFDEPYDDDVDLWHPQRDSNPCRHLESGDTRSAR
jgi:hypothetical protein